jgi:hypothetical protein
MIDDDKDDTERMPMKITMTMRSMMMIKLMVTCFASY